MVDVTYCVWAILAWRVEDPLTADTARSLTHALTGWFAAIPIPERQRALDHLWSALDDELKAIEKLFAEAPQCPRALSTN